VTVPDLTRQRPAAAAAPPARILVIDDESGVRQALAQLLEYEGYEVATASGGAEGLATAERVRPHLVFLDVKMAGMDGLDVLRRLKQSPDADQLTVVMISGHATIQTAVEATQLGAYDILEKPLDTDRVLVLLRNVLAHQTLSEENARLRERIDARDEMVGESYALRALRERIEKVAGTPARVLITGENGSGKELVARAIHRHSSRARKPFVEVNCAAIPSELIESELFGHMKGSFTGAVVDRAGKFEQADGGTLFLDEIGDMSSSAQAKVLRVLQDGVVTRIGSAKPVTVDVRVLAATNKVLPDEIAAGRFREDLFYRLNVVPIQVPSLRERRDDIPLLVRWFLQQFASEHGMPARSITDEALLVLRDQEWPGNVRELRNAVERLMILAGGSRITAVDVDRVAGRVASPASASAVASLGGLEQCRTFEEFKLAAERAFLLAKLRANDWNVSETARVLEMPRSNLYKKIERYGLARE
jgi:two-component system, NtrC family, nitrogen regulation response regulator NtrX